MVYTSLLSKMHLRVYLKVQETATVSFVLSGGRMLLLTEVKSGLIFQHERGLWKTFLQLDCLFPLRASLFLMLTVGENG